MSIVVFERVEEMMVQIDRFNLSTRIVTNQYTPTYRGTIFTQEVRKRTAKFQILPF